MNIVFQLATSPLGNVLWKWTLLLALGWAVYGWLRRWHPRWRLILWRSLLIFSLALPLVSILPLPGLVIPLHETVSLAKTETKAALPALRTEATPAETTVSKYASPPALNGPAVTPTGMVPESTASMPFPWRTVALAVWSLGCACGVIRLIWFHAQLARLRGRSEAPSAALADLAEEIRIRFGVQRRFRLRISDGIQSPFVCGLWRPTIMLPRRLMETLSREQTTALLRHEIAHLRGHDLLWSAGWRWLQVVGWFQPLAWRIPAAHSFACEQEADRLASGQAEERESYAQLLAQLTLRVLAVPAVETKLTLNGTAQIVRRLKLLQGAGVGAWTRRHSVTGLCLVGLLFLIAAGCKFANSGSETQKQKVRQFKEAMVEVLDENGQPLAGATVKPTGFRVQGVRRVDWYGWKANQFGPANPVTTDRDGKAWIKYPVVAIPSEKLLTGTLIFRVSHPDYCPIDGAEDNLEDGTGNSFRLTKGISVEVSGYYGPDRQPVTDLVPNLTQEGVSLADWQKEGNGIYTSHQISPGHHLIQLMGRLPSGEIVFSDTVDFTAERGKPNRLEIEMKPGIRIEGRLDDNVPRPVKNGRVLVNVRPPQFPAYLIYQDAEPIWKKYGYFNFWHTWRPIAEDGTFVFESVPPGEVDVIVHGDGFVSRSIGNLEYRTRGHLTPGPHFAIPQPFKLTAPLTKIVVATEPTATLELTAKTESGKPIEGATVELNPNVFRMGGIFGNMRQSSEEPFRAVNPLPPLTYSGTTDSNGWVEIRNLPAEEKGLSISDPRFEVPLRDKKGLPNRRVAATFAPGTTNTITVTMEPLGTDFIGTTR